MFLRAWSSNIANRMQYHNEAMKCCRVSIRDISKRRALWHDQHAGEKSLPTPLRSLESLSLLLHQRAGDHLQNILVLESVSCMSYSAETRKTNR